MVSSSAKSLKAKAFNRDYKEHDFSEGGQQDNLNLDKAVTKPAQTLCNHEVIIRERGYVIGLKKKSKFKSPRTLR